MIAVDAELGLWRQVIVDGSVVLMVFEMVGVKVELDF